MEKVWILSQLAGTVSPPVGFWDTQNWTTILVVILTFFKLFLALGFEGWDN